MHSKTVQSLRLQHGDRIRISSTAGEIQAIVQEVSTIRPDTIAINIENVDPAYSSNRIGRREKPLDLLGKEQNESGDLAFAAGKAKVAVETQYKVST